MSQNDQSFQYSLLGNSFICPDVGGLPLITNPSGEYEVIAPASIYQPLLLKPSQKNIKVGPGALDEYEEKFIRDLVRFLYPAGNPPKSPKTPMKWGDKEVWIKRNLEKNEDSFRLRIEESDWYYPDFVIWIIDSENKEQTLAFVDPKGLTMGVKGWGDYKVLCTAYMPHVVERSLESPLMIDDESWTFRIRGILLSNTKYKDINAQEKLYAHDKHGQFVGLSESEFATARIFFQKEILDYIPEVLMSLQKDSEFDELMSKAAQVYHDSESFTPNTEADFELLIRYREHQGSESEYVASIIRDFTRKADDGSAGNYSFEKRRGQLLKYAQEGKFGMGAESAKKLANIAKPCEELWKRMNK